MNIKNKKITIIGAVKSGVAAAKLVKNVGGIPFVSEISEDETLKEFFEELKNESIEFEIGGHSDSVYDCSLMVVSPGVPIDAPVLIKARQKGN